MESHASNIGSKEKYNDSSYKNNLFARNIIGRFFIVAFFVVLSIIALFPLYYLIVSSFKPADQLFTTGLDATINLKVMNLKNYISLFGSQGGLYLSWYKNSLIITILGTILTLLLSSMVGYGLAVYQFRGRNLIFTLVLFIMMVPMEMLLLPMYKLMVSLNLLNTYWGVILPGVVSPTAVFFFRQYAAGLSKDFMDAARIDGCTEFGIFWRVMAPLMIPAFGAMTILVALGNWNNFLWPLIVMRTDQMFTLPVGLMSLLTPYESNYSVLLSGSVLSILPIVIIYLINQEAFMSGLTVGGIKG
ncbi:MAG: arabinooligosaccharide transport system permease protein [Thermoanaerobacterium sp.]|uniref:Arabinosaccharide transport system permease protein n=1 Tax=Thermoanaerobacterium butyriciformans TaxID=1702242 RepID=A0ABS4NBL0_9THEO|nr:MULTISPECIES: carbohydrate ABC transporter permease [Thermoanaerobacterium]MDI3477261.1 arabinooligosaccharide transport system permease protein [Thermoanaerobacterium sp.]MBP2071052.1 arabinosaccharide transport system permease protein [Thermoanaerobacterium butyriciformans]MDK2805012.1 arabinooligosaccharide transport system permease protein [Thermoanaerobacterium sp.]MDN5316384.1 arabinooligosaccharide transport system permease protein [Thermoanaerobacterium sp.]WKV08272.1 carbohydrate A